MTPFIRTLYPLILAGLREAGVYLKRPDDIQIDEIPSLCFWDLFEQM